MILSQKNEEATAASIRAQLKCDFALPKCDIFLLKCNFSLPRGDHGDSELQFFVIQSQQNEEATAPSIRAQLICDFPLLKRDIFLQKPRCNFSLPNGDHGD